MKTSISSIMSGKPPKGVNKYMLEEVYFSEVCEEDASKGNNPQCARFIEGKYYFNFPDLWYNNLSNNKAIGLRKIDLRAGSLNLALSMEFKRCRSGSGVDPQPKTVPIRIVARPNESTYSILETICRYANVFIGRGGKGAWSSDAEKTIKLVPFYNYEHSTATIQIQRDYTMERDPYTFSFKIYDLNEDAREFFNVKTDELPYEEAEKGEDGTQIYTFNDVWNREFLFVHASFVNGTSFNYLGRSGEFYPKPSKMYRFGGSSQQFYFELSYDGRNPCKKRIGAFCIDLAFIYHDKDYQAE